MKMKISLIIVDQVCWFGSGSGDCLWQHISPQGDDTKERRKFIAFMFMDGADKKQYGYLMKSSETDHSLGKTDVYPDGIESALQVSILYSEKALKKKKKEETDNYGTGRSLLGMRKHRTPQEGLS